MDVEMAKMLQVYRQDPSKPWSKLQQSLVRSLAPYHQPQSLLLRKLLLMQGIVLEKPLMVEGDPE